MIDYIKRKDLFGVTAKVFGMMLLTCVIVVLISKDLVFGASIAEYDEDKEMVLAFVVNRHGERTPAEEEAALSKDRELLKELTFAEGYEGLTNEGKRRAFQIGKFFRQRYGSKNGLLSKLYLQNELSLRSTDKERTKMTAQIAMSALYPPVGSQKWDEGLGRIWQPVPYTAVPLSEDYLRFYSNCDYYKALLQRAKQQSLTEEFLPYLDLIPLLKEETGANFTEDPLLFQTLHDLFSSQVILGLEIPTWAKPLLPRLTEAATLAYRLYLRTEEMRRIGGGVMLNDFIQMANAITEGKEVTKRVHIYSSHDFNLGSLMGVSKVIDSDLSLPEYGAIFALELYRSKSTGQYYVLPIYVPQAGNSPIVARQIEGCDKSYCAYDTFRRITDANRLPENEFYSLCNMYTQIAR